MNSDKNKNKEKKKKKKIKKSHEKNGEITSKIQEDQKKGSILSKLDDLDEIVKKESRVVEETLRSGLIKREQAEKEEIAESEELTVIKIKKEINDLQIIKNKYHVEGNYEKAIKTSKKIIVLAFSNNLKPIVDEENKFLDIIQKKEIQEPEEIKRIDVSRIEPKIQNAIGKETLTFKKAKEDFEQKRLIFKEEQERFKQEKQKLEEEKEYLKQERIRFEEEKQTFTWEKQMYDEIQKHEKEKRNGSRET